MMQSLASLAKRGLSGLLGLLLCGVLPLAATSGAQTAPPAGFERGNALYAAGKYADAAAAYEGAVRTGVYSGNLFYNLGNAYERLGERGRSILNYQRALLVDPGNAAARANLSLVRGRGVQPADDSWLGRQFEAPAIDLWPILSAAAGSLGLLLLVTGAFRRPRNLVFTALCFAVCAFAAGWIWWIDEGLKNAGCAIVLRAPARALSSPANDSQLIASLPLGSEVRVLSEQGAWVYAQVPDGSRGWLPAGDVEKITPAQS